MLQLTLSPLNDLVCRVLTHQGAHVGNLKWINGAWKFKAIGYDDHGDVLPGGGPLTHFHNEIFATLDAAEVNARLVWNPRTLLEMVGNNPDARQRLLDKFLTNATVQMAQIQAAMHAGDCPVMVSVAHPLKSAARTVGALQMGEACQALEAAARAQDTLACTALVAALQASFNAAAQAIRAHLET
jgi:HPt (histidine-containing phosphotransfer) domain-containing protein